MATARIAGGGLLSALTRPRSRLLNSETCAAWLLILPSLIGLIVFYLVPAIRAVEISLSDWNLMSPPRAIGLANYRMLLADAQFWHALELSALYVLLNIPLQTVLGLMLALLMDRLTCALPIRAILLLPFLLSNVLVALMWVWLLDPVLGWVNVMLNMFGMASQSFFGSPVQALATVAAVNTWRYMGMVSLLFLAGMQRIPRGLYEAASLDGVSEWHMFRRITLPLLRPVMLFVIITSVTGALQVFDTVAVATHGGPADSTRVIVYYIYETAFRFYKMGYACAMSLALLLVMTVYTVLQMRMFRADESDLAFLHTDAGTEDHRMRASKTAKGPLSVGRCMAWMALIAMIAVSVMPLWIVLRTALTPTRDLFANATAWLPSTMTLDNFRRAFGLVSSDAALAASGASGEFHFLHALLNSVIFTVLIVSGQVVFSVMAAYAFARLRFQGRALLFGLFLLSMMMPNIVLLIPNFILIKELGWLNTYAGMVAPMCLVSAFAIFFLRQAFLSIPRELEEAARLDGASHLRILWRIVIPLSVAPIATVAILCGINAWNEFLWPFIVANSDDMQVLTVALQSFKSQAPQGTPDWPGLMAATCLAVLPTLALLIGFGRHVVDSVQSSRGK